MNAWVADSTYGLVTDFALFTPTKHYPMHLEIDFDNKVIIVLEEVEVIRLMDYIMTLDKWQEYKIYCREIHVYDEEETDDGFYRISLN